MTDILTTSTGWSMADIFAMSEAGARAVQQAFAEELARRAEWERLRAGGTFDAIRKAEAARRARLRRMHHLYRMRRR